MKTDGMYPIDIPPSQGFYLLLHFPLTKRHRQRDLTVAKVLLFLSSFRKKTKSGKSRREALHAWNGSTQPHSKSGTLWDLTGPPIPQHPQWQQESRMWEWWAPLPFSPDWGGQALLITTLITNNPILYPKQGHGSLASKMSSIILTLIYQNKLIINHIT